MNRHQRRAAEKTQRIESKNNPINKLSYPKEASKKEDTSQINALNSEIQKLLYAYKRIEGKYTLLMDTLCRLNICSIQDLRETENLYLKRDIDKKNKIKSILEKELELEDYIDLVKEADDLPEYLKYRIDLIKDLNVNPYELAHYFKRKHPDKTPEDVYNMYYLRYNFKKEHFSITK